MKKKRVLILCTGNSARSQLAEALLRHIAGDRFEVASAGVKPTAVKPEVKEVLDEVGIGSDDLWSKSVDVFAEQKFDHIITVCDNANENCPVFPGKAARTHCGIDDPAAVGLPERLNAFRGVRDELLERLKSFSRQA